ncbi:hypothetical protein [Flavobacterium sp. ACAM 123]|uniref:hypothetical protein n=1 Tax=Flavobacterium sp. ACAM 123 TaxID=1189620 RepID=UPI000375E50D|nr:hypothetical protein [Flavobacterium sp. ACAM 123]
MEDHELADVLKFSSPKELYVITYYNALRLLFCPFRVKVLSHVGLLRKGQLVWVNEVKVTTALKTIFIINGNAYHYHSFDILIEDITE